jgi:hypothetical protein
MIIHQIHDLSNIRAVELLKHGLSSVVNPQIIKNYNPDYSQEPGNLFFILEQGRYRHGCGKYFIIEENGEYIGSAGWNEYELDPSTALLLTRMYVDEKYRAQFYHGKYILPIAIKEAADYQNIWMTCNEHNKIIYDWFVRHHKQGSSIGNWPEVYKNFRPIGKKNIYYTDQYVVEFLKEKI